MNVFRFVLRFSHAGLARFRRGATANQSSLPESAGRAEDTLAERLRRRPAKPMGSPRVGSNPTGVVFAQKAVCKSDKDNVNLLSMSLATTFTAFHIVLKD